MKKLIRICDMWMSTMGLKEVIIKKSKWDAKKNTAGLDAESITPKDDAYHGSFNLLDIEWWYFDAIFENGYSIHVGVRTFHTNHHGVVKLRIEIYKEGKILVEALKSDLFERFLFSPETPLVKYGNDLLMGFDTEYYQKTGKWRYHVSMNIKNQAVDLTFNGLAEGWKFETPDNSWVVVFPTAHVTGTLTVDGQVMQVQGVGYHDHNWDYSIATAVKNWGWFWGRITGESFNLIWAKTMRTLDDSTLLAVISPTHGALEDGKGFISIQQDAITLTPKQYMYSHHRCIPTHLELSINENKSIQDKPVQASLLMELIDVQHSRIFTAHYWRYHMKTSGTITVGSKTETFVDSSQIIEFLLFKRQKKMPQIK